MGAHVSTIGWKPSPNDKLYISEVNKLAYHYGLTESKWNIDISFEGTSHISFGIKGLWVIWFDTFYQRGAKETVEAFTRSAKAHLQDLGANGIKSDQMFFPP